MPRRRRCRRVISEPLIDLFKPTGERAQNNDILFLRVEELEALRLKDFLGLEQEACAREMQVSRPTFQRILSQARYQVAQALLQGKILRIEGGDYCLGQGYCRRHERDLLPEEWCSEETGEIASAMRRESEMNDKIVICASGDHAGAPVDDRFGRCAYFIVYDPAGKSYEAIPNSGSGTPRGAGTGSAQKLISAGTAAVIANRIGPKAFEALHNSGIRVFSGAAGLSVQEALEKYQAGQLQELHGPNN